MIPLVPDGVTIGSATLTLACFAVPPGYQTTEPRAVVSEDPAWTEVPIPKTAAEARAANGRDAAGALTRTTVLDPGSSVFSCAFPRSTAPETESVEASHEAKALRSFCGDGSIQSDTVPDWNAVSVGLEIVTETPRSLPGVSTPASSAVMDAVSAVPAADLGAGVTASAAPAGCATLARTASAPTATAAVAARRRARSDAPLRRVGEVAVMRRRAIPTRPPCGRL